MSLGYEGGIVSAGPAEGDLCFKQGAAGAPESSDS